MPKSPPFRIHPQRPTPPTKEHWLTLAIQAVDGLPLLASPLESGEDGQPDLYDLFHQLAAKVHGEDLAKPTSNSIAAT